MTDEQPILPARRRRRGVSIGLRLKRYREELGWTQAQLAERAGLSLGTVGRVERGRERPLGRTAESLAGALGLPVEQLLGLDGAQPGLFPAPEEVRMGLVRQVVALGDDEVERAVPLFEQVFEILKRPQRPE